MSVRAASVTLPDSDDHHGRIGVLVRQHVLARGHQRSAGAWTLE